MKLSISLAALSLMLAVAACNETQFAGGGKTKNSAKGAPEPEQEPTPPTDEPTAEPVPEPEPKLPTCENATQVTGAHLAFLIDNSGSMTDTDCPGKRIERRNNRSIEVCDGQTDREKAVVLAFDALALVYKNNQTESARSSFSFARFTPNVGESSPNGRDSVVSIDAFEASRQQVVDRLDFTHRPQGDTPYSNAVREGQRLVNAIRSKFGNDGKPVVLVMVTDGEPTDNNPADVAARAAAMKKELGVQWITIMVNSGQLSEDRKEAHRKLLLDSYENNDYRSPNSHWYSSNYANFNVYFDDIIALSGKISDQIIEVASSDKLQQVVMEEVIKKKVECK